MIETPDEVSTTDKVSVLFVCTANVCRSPTAHGVFEDYLKRTNLEAYFNVDSAGTKAQHTGKPPEARAQKIAVKAGYDLSHLIARPLLDEDFMRFDYIIAMDSGHLNHIESMQPPTFAGTAALLMSFSNEYQGSLDIPDPYYGATNDFVVALDLVEQGCIGLLEHIVNTDLAGRLESSQIEQDSETLEELSNQD